MPCLYARSYVADVQAHTGSELSAVTEVADNGVHM